MSTDVILCSNLSDHIRLCICDCCNELAGLSLTPFLGQAVAAWLTFTLQTKDCIQWEPFHSVARLHVCQEPQPSTQGLPCLGQTQPSSSSVLEKHFKPNKLHPEEPTPFRQRQISTKDPSPLSKLHKVIRNTHAGIAAISY